MSEKTLQEALADENWIGEYIFSFSGKDDMFVTRRPKKEK